MTRLDKPAVARCLACKLGFHKLVDLANERAKGSRVMRVFVVRKLEGCRRCGVVFCTRFTNPLGGGGRFATGYVDPAEIEREYPAGATSAPLPS